MERKHNKKDILLNRNNFKIKLIIESLIIGIATGFTVVLFRLLIEESGYLLTNVYSMLAKKPGLIPLWIILLFAVGFIIRKMVKDEPMISGSGIPQVEGVLLRNFDLNWWKVLLFKFTGGVLSIGSGMSLGREGPSVQLGACVGQGLSRMLKRTRVEEKFLITSGASAGLAAAFNAPLAGALFALEEVHKNFSPLVLLSSLTAALSSNFAASEFFGLKPVFSFGSVSMLPLKYYPFVIILGLVLGLAGILFNRYILLCQKLYSKLNGYLKEHKILIPLLISIIPGLVLPQILGGGNQLIVSLTNGNFTLKILLILLIGKFLFTIICFGSGAPGGIFLPMLTLGALIGCIYGIMLEQLLGIDSTFINNFIILSMAGYFTAVVRSPITGIILITEMTGSLDHLFSLSLVSIISYITADLLKSKPVYEALLDNLLAARSHPEIQDSRLKSVIEQPVCMGSYAENKKVRDINWPVDCLLVGVKRGNIEILPKGGTRLYAGDYLTVLTEESKHSITYLELQQLCTNSGNKIS